MKRMNIILAGAAVIAWLSSMPAAAQTWLDFAHPNDPHLGLPNPDVWLTNRPLLQHSGDVQITKPALFVLMEFSDVTHRPDHTVAFWRDLAFGDPRPGIRPSVAQTIRANSNGRLLLVPATAGDIYDGSPDGIVGWVASSQTAAQLADVHLKRAEAVIVADPWFDYDMYDTNLDDVIDPNELLIVAVFADHVCCDQHDPALGHSDPNNCANCPGGNTRTTNPTHVPVEQGTAWEKEVYQWIAGVGEITRMGVVVHEIGHSLLGHGDLYPRTGCTVYQQQSDGYLCDGVWYPPRPGVFTLMDNYVPSQGLVHHLDPWGKIHLGFVKPLVVRHDGTYTLHVAETERSFSAQETQPEALIICDPLWSDPYREYFILENRDITGVPPWNMDQGLAVWLINENSSTWPLGLDFRQVVRLIKRGGHWVGDTEALWDGVDPNQGYDLTATSTPRNTSWTDGSPSYIEIYDISPAGPAMTFNVRMPPICADRANTGFENGSQAFPYDTVSEGITAIPEPPRSLRIAGGSYPETMVVSTPCTLMGWHNGNAVIGQ